MRKNVIICDMSDAAIEVTIQNAQYYTPPVLQLKTSTSDVELLLTDEQLFQLEQSIADYKNRIQAKGAATA